MRDSYTIQSTDSLSLELPIAGIGSRSYAFIIDWHIRLLVGLAWFFSVILIYKLLDLSESDDLWQFADDWFVYTAIYPALFIYFFYHPVLEMWRKQTPGKRFAKVRLVTLEGGTPSVMAMLIRNLFRMIDSLPTFYMLGFFIAMFNRNHVRIGDMAARTVLIHDEELKAEVLDDLIEVESRANRLSLQDRELLVDILERWKGMDIEVRVRIAKQFLARLKVDYSRIDKIQAQDRVLHGKLTSIREHGLPDVD